MISGYSGRKAEHEQETLRQAELQNAREARIYEALINSPDPEIKAAAITGLLASSQSPKKKRGFAGWMGEMESNPAYAQIQSIINTPVQSEEPATFSLGSRQSIGISDLPPGGPGGSGSLALPETSPTEIGSPPPTPTSPVAALTPAGSQTSRYSPPAVTSTRTVSKPRQIFRSPEEQTLLTHKASAQGNVEGEVAGLVASGMSDQEARTLIKQKYERLARGGVGAAPFRAVAGTMPDGTNVSAVFDQARGHYIHPVTGDVLEGFVARQTGASAPRFGQDREAIAEAEFGKSYGQLDQAQQQVVMAKQQTFLKESAGSRVSGAGEAKMEVPADLRTAQLTGVPVGSTAAQVEGQRVGTIAQQTRRNVAGTIKTQLGEIKALFGPLPRSGSLGSVAPGWAIAASRAQDKNRVAWGELDSAINNIRASLTRTIAANVGTETEKDAERALSTIADIEASFLNPLKGDTQESATARIDQTVKYLDEVIASLPGAPVIGAPPPAPPAPGGTRTAQPVSGSGPAGYTVDDDGQLLFQGQPVL
jgi:hypothetical protein